MPLHPQKEGILIRNFPDHYGIGMRIYANVINYCGKLKVIPIQNRLSKADKKQFKKTLKPGDIVLTGSIQGLSYFFVKGAVTHSMMYLGKNSFIHAFAHGVVKTSIKTVFSNYDTLVILRHPGMTPQKLKEAKKYMNSQIGTPYNFNFESEEGSLICSELIKNCLDHCGLTPDLPEERFYSFYELVHPMDLVRSPSFQLEFLSRNLSMEGERLVYLW